MPTTPGELTEELAPIEHDQPPPNFLVLCAIPLSTVYTQNPNAAARTADYGYRSGKLDRYDRMTAAFVRMALMTISLPDMDRILVKEAPSIPAGPEMLVSLVSLASPLSPCYASLTSASSCCAFLTLVRQKGCSVVEGRGLEEPARRRKPQTSCLSAVGVVLQLKHSTSGTETRGLVIRLLGLVAECERRPRN